MDSIACANNEVEELERMVKVFRLNELKQLLMLAHQPVAGRKSELTDRALALVRSSKRGQFKAKIKQLYLQIYDRDRALLEAQFTAAASSPYGAYANAVVHSASTVCDSAGSNSNDQTYISHIAARQNITLYPRVKLTNLPFYDVIAEVVKPTTVVPMTAGKIQDSHLTFVLSHEHMGMVSTNERTPLPRIELQLRFCSLDLNGQQKDDFPSGCVLRMNEKIVQIPNIIPTNKVGVEAKRPSRPVDVTPYVSRVRDGEQRIHVTWNYDGARLWTMSLYVVRHLTMNVLLQRVRAKGERPEAESIKMIKDKLGIDAGDGDIAATSLRVSLLCPLGKIRMHLPCRLQSCKHLQCFDLELFLLMNEKRPTWTCPVCDSPVVPFSDLQIDGYFSRVITDATDANEVELYEGGAFSAIVEDDSPAVKKAERSKPLDVNECTIVDDSPAVKISCQDLDEPNDKQKLPIGQAAVEISDADFGNLDKNNWTITKKGPHNAFTLRRNAGPSRSEVPPSKSGSSQNGPADEPLLIELSSDDEDDEERSSERGASVSQDGSSASNCSSSPSVIILDSPQSPDTPKSSAESDLDPPIQIPQKRVFKSSPSSSFIDVKKRLIESSEASTSSTTPVDEERSMEDVSPLHLPTNGLSAEMARMIKQLIDRSSISPAPESPCYRFMPPPPAYSVSSPMNGIWRPLLSTNSFASSSQTSNIPTSTGSTWPTDLTDEFEAFLSSCLPSSQ